MDGGGKGGPSGTTTSTQTSEPWGPQQPYLSSIFSGAQGLYQGAPPQYYPDQTHMPQTWGQTSGLQGLMDVAGADPLQFIPSESLAQIAGGSYLNQNPATAGLTQAAGGNQGADAANANLGQFAGLNYGDTSNLWMYPYANQSYGEDVFRNDVVPFSNTNYGNTAAQTMDPFAQNNAYFSEPGNQTLAGYSGGDRLAAGNPYADALTQSVSARALPGIQAQFIDSGMMSSPEAMRASAAGLTSAIAPFQFQNYQNEEANQLAAANSLGNRYMQGWGMQQGAAQDQLNALMQGYGLQQQAGLQGADLLMQGHQQQQSAAQNIADRMMAGRQAQQSAAGDITNSTLAGAGLQQQAMGTLGSQYQGGIDSMLRAAGLAPSVQAGQYSPFETMFNAGTAQQGLYQQNIDDAINRWNYQQELPYNQLNEYIGQVTGNYGGTTQLTQPYFNNSNSLTGIGTALGGAGSLISGLGGGAAGSAVSGLGSLGLLMGLF